MNFTGDVLSAGVQLTVPILFAAMGELIAERSGVLNIGLEGMMAAGGYVGFIVMSLSHEVGLAVLGGMVAGLAVSEVMALLSVVGPGNQIISGFAVYLIFPALTGFLYLQMQSSWAVTATPETVAIPLLSKIPIIGQALFSGNVFYYVVILVCLAVWILLSRTRLGLEVTAVGHDPHVAHAKGIPCRKVRVIATLICGSLAGLGGVALVVGSLGDFSDGVIDGRGFIAIAAVILGRWRVGGVVVAAAGIGLLEALQLRLSSVTEISPTLLGVVPWLAVMVMLGVGARLGTSAPRSLGRSL